MNFRHLEYFVHAVECKSLNRAARHLDISPQTLHAGIHVLEKELGYALLNRSSAGVTPTQNGELIYKDALQILEKFNLWHSLALTQKKEENIMVRLGASTTLMRWLVPKILSEIKQTSPHIYLDLYESFAEQVFRTVIDKRMLGMIAGVTKQREPGYRMQLLQNDMEAEPGPEDRCVVVLNRKHPYAALPRLTLKLLADLRMVWTPHREKSFVYREICQHFSPSHIINLPEQESLLRVVAMETDIATCMPRSGLHALGDWGDNLCGLDVEDFPMPARIWLVYPRRLRSAEKTVLEGIRNVLSNVAKDV